MEKTKIAMTLDKEMEPIKKMCEPLEEAVKHELSKGIENVDAKELGEVVDMIKDLYEAKEKLVKAFYYKQIMEAMEEHDFEDEEEIMDEGRKGYRGQPRSKTSGRYMRRGDGRRSYSDRMGYDEMMMPEYMRDMDVEQGKMYYSSSTGSSGMSGTTSGGSSSGRMGYATGAGFDGSNEDNKGGVRYYSDSSNMRDGREGRSGQSRRGYMEAKEMHKGNSPEDMQAKKKELEQFMKDTGEDLMEMIEGSTQEEKNMLKTRLQTLAQKI